MLAVVEVARLLQFGADEALGGGMSEEKLSNMLGQDRITSRQIDELVGLARIRATRTLPSCFAGNLEWASVN